ncbi:MAG: tRNA dihydrouridine synthase DusB ['Candidatus Kapabacteria' thiocyanatum]|uniref:tRNA-dihydrouridine synthase n=1 Tax=Candidatus Kapaibacterium thiocyanatum TaxID=1895771 RepID=A0A1M3L6J8_9BACT|nr:tRNA dihydrouridine synthase DusB ['Candidatus Kapabacteria' thiocyanatum]OJX61202.1 MAG: tRNA dihydrouridine synthase DusB ['Candidatus Kapabacteria' thiocyanatum]
MRIGTVDVEQGLLLAPMEDVTDLPFRVICKRYGADIVYTEFISSDGLIRDARRSMEKLRLADEEHPVSIQIFGGDIPVMIEAAQRAEESGPDFIDINCGCWVKNVVARNAGAALLKDPPKMAEMTRALVDNVKLPVTVKTRLGWSPDEIVILDVARMLEDAGAAALTVHCRTRDQGHSGDADWTWIPRIKQVVNIPVILNGDVQTPEDVRRAFAETGADAVMIGRAAIGNPFVFNQAKEYMRTGTMPAPVSHRERIDVCLEHLRLELEWKPLRRAVHEFRKHYGGYLKGLPNNSLARQDVVRYETYEEISERLLRYADDLDQTELTARPLPV